MKFKSKYISKAQAAATQQQLANDTFRKTRMFGSRQLMNLAAIWFLNSNINKDEFIKITEMFKSDPELKIINPRLYSILVDGK